MTELACARKDCAMPGRHKTEHQPDDECRGCQPALAQDGLRLCPVHTTRIATDALRCAELDHELEQVLGSTGRPGERTTGTADHGTVINEKALQVRSDIRNVLASWARMISEERGIGLPPDHLDAVGAYLATHKDWLAAHPAAADCSDELASLQRRAWNTAYPSGARVFPVGPCPTCGTAIKVVLRAVDSLLPSELVCEADEPHRWGASQWHSLGRRMLKAGR